MIGGMKTAILGALLGLALCVPVRAAGEDSGKLTESAAALLRDGKTQEALALLRRLIAGNPKLFPAYSLLGVAYTQLGQLEEARRYFEKAVQLAPRSPQARNNLGANYLALRRPAEAKRQFESVLASDPTNLTAWVNLAQSYTQLGDSPKALVALNRAQQLAPEDLEVQFALAEARLRTGQAEAPLQQIRELARRPGGGLHVMALARKNIDLGDYNAALALLELLEGSDRSSAAWHEMKGYVHFKLDQPEPALEHLQKAVRLEPHAEDHYLALAEFLGANNAVGTAVTVLEGAQKILPRSVKIQSGLGVAYLMNGNVDQAEALLRAIVERQPGHEVGYQLLAECYERAQAWDNLQAVADQLRRLNPDNGIGWYYAGLARYHVRQGQGRGASLQVIRRYLGRALQIQPNDWRSHVLLGKLLLEEGKDAPAVLAFRKAISSNDEEPSVHYLLASTLQRLGKTDESEAAFAAFREAKAKEKARQFRTLVVNTHR